MAREGNRPPLVRAAFGAWWHAWRIRVRRVLRPTRRVPMPERLLFAPQDLRSADPAVAVDLRDGVVRVGHGSLSVTDRALLDAPPPSREWAEDLYGFAWLRSLRADGSAEAREGAQALLRLVLSRQARTQLETGTGATIGTIVDRLTAMLAHSPGALTGADFALYRAYLRRVRRDTSSLKRLARDAIRPLDRLRAAIAVATAALCCAGLEREIRGATRRLSDALGAQVLADGGHVDRDPETVLRLLLDLQPLRLLYAGRALEVPPGLDGAIDRMVPFLRSLRHGSGDLALFNGAGRTASPELVSVLTQDRSRAAPLGRAAASGFDRLEAGATVVIVETGAAPPIAAASRAGAGCLSLELSSGSERIVVNCGAPPASGPAREASRRTSAHSTLGLAGASSGFLLDPDGPGGRSRAARRLLRYYGPVLLPGPTHVAAERGRDGAGFLTLSAHHDGYVRAFGATHTRRLRLSPDGGELEGEDALGFSADAGESAREALVRFHLDPAVGADIEGPSGAVLLTLRSGERWRFGAEGVAPRLAPSVLFASPEGRRATRQIVLPLRRETGADRTAVRWLFLRA